jgi:hypothetical protein
LIALAVWRASLFDFTGEDGGDDIFAARATGFNFRRSLFLGLVLESRRCRTLTLGACVVYLTVS